MRVIFIFLLFCSNAIAQDYSIGAWKSHFPVNLCIDLTQSKTEVFAASPSGIIVLDKVSLEKTVLTKSEGLMDVDITSVYYNTKSDQLIIAYESGGIDLYKEGVINSFLDIIRSSIVGSKSINNIKEHNGLLYLSTDFGVVVFDDIKKEVKDTYYIGANGDLSINDVEFFENKIYTATATGVYSADVNSILSNNLNWIKQTIPSSEAKFSSIFSFNNKLFTNLNGGNYFSDTLFVLNDLVWEHSSILAGSRNKSFEKTENFLAVATDYGVAVYDTSLTRTKFVYEYSPKVSMEPSYAVFDDKDISTIWCADKNIGLVKNTNTWYSSFFNYNTPISLNVNKIEVADNQVWMATGGVNGSQWQNVWLQEGISFYDGLDWVVINKSTTTGLDTVFDYVDIAIDPNDKNHVFVATLGDGLLEFQNNEVINHFFDNNSTLQHVEPASAGWWWVGVTSTSYDYNGNLWTANHSVDNSLSVYDTEGKWHAIDIRPYTSSRITGDLINTSNNQVWLLFPKTQGILIYESNQTFDDTSDDNGITLTQAQGLPSNTVFSIAEDLDGEIWIGTDKGIGVVYSPQNIFTGGELEVKQILIEQDGYTEYLLENNSVSSIAVDGANRKWIGTRSSGVFLLSSDGTEEIARFTKENSALPSNEIKTIAVNQTTGEVFFGTNKGIVSLRADATFGSTSHVNVKVYPNPVRENYRGPIAIKGLAANSNIKITDVSGNIVFETTSLGGQAIWYGNNQEGERVATGVYLVFSSSDNGLEKFTTKVLFIN